VPEPFGLLSEVRRSKCVPALRHTVAEGLTTLCCLPQARHEGYEERKRVQLMEEEAARRAEAEFKAQPMWQGRPFRLEPAEPHLTVPEEVALHTSLRAEERQAFDDKTKEKWHDAEVRDAGVAWRVPRCNCTVPVSA
jgi:hypothetical protein